MHLRSHIKRFTQLADGKDLRFARFGNQIGYAKRWLQKTNFISLIGVV